MSRSTSTLRQTVAFVALAGFILRPANAAFTLPLTETTVTKAQRQDGAQTEGMAAAAGGAPDTTGADAWFSLLDENIVLTVDAGLGAETGGGVYKMVVDSASPYLWAATPSCEGCKVAPGIKRYDMGTSHSYAKANWTVASYSYAIGAVGGSYATETFSLGPYQAANVSFVGIDHATTWPFDTKDKNVVGLLPLGHGNAKVTDTYGQESRVKSPLMALYENQAIDDPVVGVVVQGDTPQLTIGGIDEYWTRNMDEHVTLPSQAKETYYQIPMDNVVAFGNTTVYSSGDTAIVDTAASHIFGPWNVVEEIYKKFEGMRYTDPLSDDKSTYYAIPCKEPEGFSLSFGFGGKQFPVKYEALVNTQWPVQRYVNGVLDTSVYQDGRWCHGNLQETTMLNFSDGQDTSDRRWLMGLSFLRNVYAGFNFVSGELSLWPLNEGGLNNTVTETDLESKVVQASAVSSGIPTTWHSSAVSNTPPVEGHSLTTTATTAFSPSQSNGGHNATLSSGSPSQGLQRRREWRG